MLCIIHWTMVVGIGCGSGWLRRQDQMVSSSIACTISCGGRMLIVRRKGSQFDNGLRMRIVHITRRGPILVVVWIVVPVDQQPGRTTASSTRKWLSSCQGIMKGQTPIPNNRFGSHPLKNQSLQKGFSKTMSIVL